MLPFIDSSGLCHLCCACHDVETNGREFAADAIGDVKICSAYFNRSGPLGAISLLFARISAAKSFVPGRMGQILGRLRWGKRWCTLDRSNPA